MDRAISPNPPPPFVPARTLFRIESGTYCEPDAAAACSLFAPMHYEPRYAYPLVVWLHGSASEERQLLRVMPLVSMRNYIAVAPRGTFYGDGASAGASGYDWRQTERHIAMAEHRVFDGIAMAREKYHVHAGRVFLVGFDSGGTMAFRIALAHPERFAGVVSLGGPLPTGGTPLGSLVAARRLPVLMASGNHSATHPAERMCDNLRLLHTAGMSITVRQYPCGQELSPQMLADVDRWIIEQITHPRCDPAETDAE